MIFQDSAKIEFDQVDETTCKLGRQFQDWVSALLRKLGTSPSLAEIQRAKLLLLDRYFSFKQSADSEHRSHTGEDHNCLYHVFTNTYGAIRTIELDMPPSIDVYPGLVPPFSRPRQVNALELGDEP